MPIDVETHCAVPLPNGTQCNRSLRCKKHSFAKKRAVAGRSAPFDQLLARFEDHSAVSDGDGDDAGAR
jgi:hypothetical protein